MRPRAGRAVARGGFPVAVHGNSRLFGSQIVLNANCPHWVWQWMHHKDVARPRTTLPGGRGWPAVALAKKGRVRVRAGRKHLCASHPHPCPSPWRERGCGPRRRKERGCGRVRAGRKHLCASHPHPCPSPWRERGCGPRRRKERGCGPGGNYRTELPRRITEPNYHVRITAPRITGQNYRAGITGPGLVIGAGCGILWSQGLYDRGDGS